MATRLDFGEDAGLASAGVLSRLSPALTDVTRVATLASQLDVAGVDAALGVTKHVGPEGTLVRAAFGVGMTALSAMGPVGMAAAAIVGFVSAIFSAFRSRKIREAESRKERQKAAFEVMPPLQEPHTDLDTWYVRSVILSVMESGRWTRLFQPRF
ncbi:MAG: hypothetical protein KC636_37125, partial [Myxococcales bacterium]|nr:hypothetical protein [Myxococcales bacterium]